MAVDHGSRAAPTKVRMVLREARSGVESAMRTVRRGDISVSAAQLTYFSGIAIVPWLLLACWTTTFVESTTAAQARLLGLQVLIPPDMGGRAPFRSLVDAGVNLGIVGALITLFPATFYGEGIRRGCLSLIPSADRLTGWRARLSILPLLLFTPVAIVVVRFCEPLVELAGQDGVTPHIGRIVLGFTLTWLTLAIPIAWIFHRVAPGQVRWTTALVGALGTASFIAGFLQGFLLFLSIPVDVGVPFGGLDVVGGVVAVGLWLFVLHLLLLVGWVITTELDTRLGDRHAGRAAR